MTVKVVACIFIKQKKFLICSRPKDKSFAGFWEFPGGKIEKGEIKIKALEREIYEELSVKINKETTFFFEKYFVQMDEIKIEINFFICEKWYGEFYPMEKQKIMWIGKKQIKDFIFLKSNSKILKLIEKFKFST
ncbi:MAG: 8-oxo-dGTP diphosphatase MutT [Rickettsiales bacterium]|nr:8-oxo-dGTP diphosphatase MutT [Rickettsiales bacterium]OUV54250.1 MAG: hypothetical protein CBC87_02965 [Rickettsiales bacterium TMED127]|tara:strand:+ start:21436 stop:21837 length:402 start_codon:yes stop_codon:yes gene_type:complete